MGLEIQNEGPSTWRLDLTGTLLKNEMDKAQSSAVSVLQSGKIKLLVILNGFDGWETGASWDDISFTAAYGDQMEKMAIVGDAKWETPFLMFVGAGFRKTQIRYFAPSDLQAARAWLGLEAGG